ncbi:MAG: hypothetical protein Q8K75_04595 [Chlamydiales bacterium]|nr:hypothetical protein [Chlamydiales bacterium]
MKSDISFADVKFSAMQALLHRVPPKLRRASLELEGNLVNILFCFDNDLGELEYRLVDEIIAQMSSDLGTDLEIRHKIITEDDPRTMPGIFSRCEIDL